ncbi:hypothetical protein L1887_30196 [Cichorium endivia]|nr:hypothetical protein L1887_30196 [Cichorium endivia]
MASPKWYWGRNPTTVYGLEVVELFVVVVAAAAVAGDSCDIDGFGAEVDCSLMWAFRNFQKLADQAGDSKGNIRMNVKKIRQLL